jgi:hypothetical protein
VVYLRDLAWGGLFCGEIFAMSDELKNCPFCGGIPEEDATGCSEYYGHDHQDYSIECQSCGATVNVFVGAKDKAHTEPLNWCDFPCSCCHNTRARCIEKWNRRAEVK